MNKKNLPIVLVILDGWGLSPAWGGNPISMNNPKNMTRFWREYPHKVLQAFTLVAGKFGVVGDSRLGHSTISAGRRLVQDFERISSSIEDRSFYKNAVLKAAIEHCKKNHSKLHLIGMLSESGIHSHLSHLFALIDFAARQNFSEVYIDIITDGIDSGANDAVNFLSKLEQKMLRTNVGKVSSISGRFYAMDRDGDYKKTMKVFQTLTGQKANHIIDPMSVLTRSYQKGLSDFNIEPTLVGSEQNPIKENDSVVFFNFRTDRALQLISVFAEPGLRIGLSHPNRPKNLFIATMTEYKKDLPVKVIFPRQNIGDILPAVISRYQKKQARIAETEKTAHVTSFFDCGWDIFPGEERLIAPSKRVKEWQKYPAMSARKITKYALSAIKSGTYEFILVNYANVDMMAHTGDIAAAGKAVNVVDEEVGKIVSANLEIGGTTIITADHGNVEQIVKFNENKDTENKHTLNPVPFILISKDNKKDLIRGAIVPNSSTLSKLINVKASLADVAPTILELMNLPKPELMTGHSLLGKLE